MPTRVLKSIKGNVVRLTRVNSCGTPITGSCASLVSECFISVTLSGEFEAGTEFVQKSAWGRLCISDKDSDALKRVNVSMQFAELNPDALDFITDSTIVTSGGDTIGSTWGTQPNTTGFALEVWTKALGVACSPTAPQWGYFLVPFIRNGKLDGDITIQNDALTVSVMGEAFPAPDNGSGISTWNNGPYTANPFVVTFPELEIFGFVTTAVQPPADTNGCVAITPP